MSSSNVSKATSPIAPVPQNYTIGGGIGSTVGSSYGFTAQTIPSSILSEAEIKALTFSTTDTMPRLILSADKGAPKVQFVETVDTGRVRVTFEPDAGMSPAELALIMCLMLTMREMSISMQVKPVTFIRQHNLERHFRFEQA